MPKESLETLIEKVFYAKPPPGPIELFIRQRQRALRSEMEFADKNLRRVAVIKRKKKKPMKKLLLLLPLVALAGCSSTNITKLVGALSKDPATCVVKVTTIYGTISYTRVGVMTNETASVNSDGSVTIKTNP